MMSKLPYLNKLAISIFFSILFSPQVISQSLLETSMESRYQLDLQVSQSELDKVIPDGWTIEIRDRGAAKDANLRVIFIERITVNGADGSPVGDGTNILVYLAAPVKNPSGESVQLIIGGMTADPADSPGPFGNYLAASNNRFDRITNSRDGQVVETQEWEFEAVTGEFIKMTISFERGIGALRPVRERLYCSNKSPAYCELSKQQQMLDIMRNVTTKPEDRVKDFSFSAGGGSYAGIFDGTERVLSWDNILWVKQEIFDQ